MSSVIPSDRLWKDTTVADVLDTAGKLCYVYEWFGPFFFASDYLSHMLCSLSWSACMYRQMGVNLNVPFFHPQHTIHFIRTRWMVTCNFLINSYLCPVVLLAHSHSSELPPLNRHPLQWRTPHPGSRQTPIIHIKFHGRLQYVPWICFDIRYRRSTYLTVCYVYVKSHIYVPIPVRTTRLTPVEKETKEEGRERRGDKRVRKGERSRNESRVEERERISR